MRVKIKQVIFEPHYKTKYEREEETIRQACGYPDRA
jgi:hypothetical protein